MHRPSRPPNLLDGSSAVTETKDTGGVPPQTSRSDTDHPEPFGAAAGVDRGPESTSRARQNSVSTSDNHDVFRRRTVSRTTRRASSGYFSSDGDSPLSPRALTADKATQTPSPTAQVILHARQRRTEAHCGGPGTHQQYAPGVSSPRPRNAAGDMQAEVIGRELRRIGDDFNALLAGRMAGRHGRVDLLPDPQPHIHHEPSVLLCMSVLILLIGRIIYLQAFTYSQDQSQV